MRVRQQDGPGRPTSAARPMTGRSDRRVAARWRAVSLALALTLAPVVSQALAPQLLLLIKQIAQQVATSMLKDSLLSGLSGMGCKGMALANALSALDLRRNAGLTPGLPIGMPAGLPALPAGMTMPTLPTGTMPPGMPGMPGGAALAIAGLPQGAGMPPEMAARMAALMPGGGALPPGLALDPAQMAAFTRMQQAMQEPPSPAQTLATIDELAELGFLPRAIQLELKECMVLIPAAVPALGMGMGMLKPIIPQLRSARDELRALSPAEQDEVSVALAQEVSALAPAERAALVEHLDLGFFPPRVVAGVKARLAAR